MIGEDGPALDPDAIAAFAHVFQAFSDPTRLTILQHLASGEHRVRDLVGHLGLAQSTVSKHVGFLLDCGLVTGRPEGRATWYRLSRPDLVASLISAAGDVLDHNGASGNLCIHMREPRSRS